MSVYSGDFLGFTIGNIHSSQLNITRVSSGDRYEDNLLPNLKDTTAEVPGGDGMYYWNTFYQQKPFTLSFAYDDLRDEDLRALRQVFGFKGVKQLIFDELPYKKYMVTCSAPPNFKYICFDQLEMRLYKGEGQANLVAYYPYAMATFSPTINGTNGMINKVGDLEAELKIIYALEDDLSFTLQLKDLDNNQLGLLKLEDIQPQMDNEDKADSYILIDTMTHLVEGLDEDKQKTGHLYNKFITKGDFFRAPVGRTQLVSDVPYIEAKYTPIYY